ncbi:hypothetical protein AAIR29_09810 [Psychrobacter sp. FBL11]|uniref:Uncharacterized protein n=1 Tax=Psychrobacter saeujeotis TaxID=3143436 RepID=A0ABU9X936_9GAMM|nr:hypothetical protein [uncultured Psychrobacter sp.]
MISAPLLMLRGGRRVKMVADNLAWQHAVNCKKRSNTTVDVRYIVIT